MKLTILLLLILQCRTVEKYNVTDFPPFHCLNPIITCNNQGKCNDQKDDCECFEGFTTNFPSPSQFFTTTTRCNYKMKKQLYALVLSLFISFGFVHFYLGNYIIGYVQLIVFLFIFIFNVSLIVLLSTKHLKKVSQSEFKKSLSYILFISFLAFVFLFWYLFDIFMVIFNLYKDGNSIHMSPLIIYK
jgi:hypothetical protein